jgi:hypothetical protein
MGLKMPLPMAPRHRPPADLLKCSMSRIRACFFRVSSLCPL